MSDDGFTSDRLNLPAAKAILAMLRVYNSTGSHPADTPPTYMRTAASTYTGKLYEAGPSGTRHATSDLTAWIRQREWTDRHPQEGKAS